MKLSKYYKIVLVAAVLIIFLLDVLNQDLTDWRPSYSTEDKIPFGLEVFDKLLPKIYPDANIKYNEQTLYNNLDSSSNSLMLFFNDNFTNRSSQEFDKNSIEDLYSWIYKGNSAFICLTEIDIDTFNIDTKSYYKNFFNDTVKYDIFYEGIESSENAIFTFGNHMHSIKKYDTLNSEVLVKFDNEIAMIRQNIGAGEIYFSTKPYLFTNANLLYEHPNIGMNILSYLPKKKNIILDQYYINNFESRNSSHPLRYILSQKSLAWAYYSLLILVILAGVLSLKRKQNPIPILPSKKNSSLAFVNTISNLYFEENTNKLMAKKKIEHLKIFLHRKYKIRVKTVNEELINKIALKSGADLKLIDNIFRTSSLIERSKDINLNNLEDINNSIDEFYKRVNNGK